MSETPAQPPGKFRLIRLPELREKLGGVAAATIWRRVKQGKLPAPIKLGPRISAWNSQEVDDWLQECAEAREREALESSRRMAELRRARQ